MAWLDESTLGMTNSYWLTIASVAAIGGASEAAKRWSGRAGSGADEPLGPAGEVGARWLDELARHMLDAKTKQLIAQVVAEHRRAAITAGERSELIGAIRSARTYRDAERIVAQHRRGRA